MIGKVIHIYVVVFLFTRVTSTGVLLTPVFLLTLFSAVRGPYDDLQMRDVGMRSPYSELRNHDN